MTHFASGQPVEVLPSLPLYNIFSIRNCLPVICVLSSNSLRKSAKLEAVPSINIFR